MYLPYMMQPLIISIKLSWSKSSLIIFLFSFLLLGDHSRARITLPEGVTVPAVIAFGDSIVDQGANNNLKTVIKANFPPYGQDFPDQMPTGRFTNNKTPADMIAKNGDWFTFETSKVDTCLISSMVTTLGSWKYRFFWVSESIVPFKMVWRHPDAILNDPEPSESELNDAFLSAIRGCPSRVRPFPEHLLVLLEVSNIWGKADRDPVLMRNGIVMSALDFIKSDDTLRCCVEAGVEKDKELVVHGKKVRGKKVVSTPVQESSSRDVEGLNPEAEELGIKEILPAYLDPSIGDKEYLTGVSFASGGSGYDPQTPKIVDVLSFDDQLKQFREYIEKLKGMVGEEKTQFILENSLFLVVAGSDDLANTYFTIGIRKLEYDIPSYAGLMASSASNFIQDIYKLGARRIAVFGAPPIGCVPSQRTLGGGGLRVCAEEYNQAAQIYNSKLQRVTQYLNSTLAQSRIVYIDIYNPLLDIIENPLQYGIQVVDKGCCGTGNIEVAILCNKLLPSCSDDSKYLFWDSYHPTNKGYTILVNRVLGKYVNDFF
ncbi:putative triacylglycerol lipase [Helianthus anomalus]